MASRPTPLAAVAIAGATAAALEVTASRLLAPFCGGGLFLQSTLLAVVGLGLAVGLGLGARASAGRLGWLLLLVGCWLLPLPWLRSPLLRWLEPAGVRLATVAVSVLLLAPPAALLGAVLPTAARALSVEGRDPARNFARAAALAIAMGVGGALLVSHLLLPRVGASRTLLSCALLQLAGAGLALSGGGRFGRGGAVSALALLAGPVAMWRAPVARAAPEFGVLRVVDGPRHEIRVLERDAARYLLVDGGIVSVVDPATWQSLERAPAVFGLSEYLFERPGRVLVLGLRGGSVASGFAHQGWIVEVADDDPAAEVTARRDFGLDPAKVSVVRAEPRAYLRETGHAYDLVVCDASGTGGLPVEHATREFFALVHARLAPRGMLALAVEAQGWHDVVVRSLAATLRASFACVSALPTAEPPDQMGSVVLLASDRDIDFPEEALPNPRAYLGDEYSHWVMVQRNHAWQNRYEPGSVGARVLTDDRNPSDLWADRIDRQLRGDLHRFFGPYGHAW